MIDSPLKVPDTVYNRVFEQDNDGAAILAELALMFYDVETFAPGQPDLSAYNQGARSVIKYIMQRASQSNGGN